MDAFFVSVELRRRPELRGLPVVVGGTGRRGVVAAASYEARRFGVHSALPSARAQRLCPHAVFLPGDHDHYRDVSRQLNDIFQSFTPFVEPLSLDEAFLDVTGAGRVFGDGATLARRLRSSVEDELQLTCSLGVAPNKFLAKLASEAAKPRARPTHVEPGREVVVVEPGHELEFLHPLPISALWGVGPATLARLDRLGVHTVAELAQLGEDTIVGAVGKAHGRHLHELSWGRDDRPVEIDRAAKSIGHEETFADDRFTHDELHRDVVRLADSVASRLRSHGSGARTVTLKVRFSGFDTITRSITLPAPVTTAPAIVAAVEPLLRSVDPTPGVRLVGVSTSNFGAASDQLALDLFAASGAGSDAARAEDRVDWVDAAEAMDAIRERFGATSIGPASAVGRRGLRLARRGAQQWGPNDPERGA